MKAVDKLKPPPLPGCPPPPGKLVESRKPRLFSETLWFKRGAEYDAAARDDATMRLGDDDLLPEWYQDNGSVSASDRKLYSLRGATANQLPAPTGRNDTTSSGSSLMRYVGGQMRARTSPLIVGVTVFGLLAGIVAAEMLGGERSATANNRVTGAAAGSLVARAIPPRGGEPESVAAVEQSRTKATGDDSEAKTDTTSPKPMQGNRQSVRRNATSSSPSAGVTKAKRSSRSTHVRAKAKRSARSTHARAKAKRSARATRTRAKAKRSARATRTRAKAKRSSKRERTRAKAKRRAKKRRVASRSKRSRKKRATPAK